MKIRYFSIFLIYLLPLIVCGNSFIDINTASLEDLQKIVGIGPKLAQAIIDARPFNSLDDLKRVKNIGEKTIYKIKQQGLAVVNPINKEIEYKSELVKKIKVGEENIDLNYLKYPKNIVFSEILPAPKGRDDEEEWIEIHNQNDFEVSLFRWQIKDIEGKVNTYIFKDIKIPPYGFIVLKRYETKIILNNEKDGLILFSPNGDIVDSISYQKAQKGQSYNRTSNGWVWSSNLTPGEKNETADEKNNIAGIEKNNFSDNLLKEKASLLDNIKESFDFLLILIIALFLAIFSGLIIFFIKRFFV